jgi:hypothetical protein
MAKFYVESGAMKLVVQAQDAEGAALWAIHRYIEKNEIVSSQDRLTVVIRENISTTRESGSQMGSDIHSEFSPLGDTIGVSEIGFGRDEAGRFKTEQSLQQYCQLSSAMQRLLDQVLGNG